MLGCAQSHEGTTFYCRLLFAKTVQMPGETLFCSNIAVTDVEMFGCICSSIHLTTLIYQLRSLALQGSSQQQRH